MDEQERDAGGVGDARFAAAFRDAAAHAPPAGFDAGDVVAASRRITRRRRSALAGGALAVLGCSPGTVKSQTAHGLTALRAALGDALDDLRTAG